MLIEVPEWRHDILQEHVENLESFWNRRLRAPRSPDLEAIGLRRLDARIEAATDALVLAGEHAQPWLERVHASEEPAAWATAALVITSGNQLDDGERRLMEAFAGGAAPVLEGVRAALELRITPGLLAGLRRLGDSAPPGVAAAAWAITAARGAGPVPGAAGRRKWIEDDAPEVRRVAWLAEARLGDRVAPRDGHGDDLTPGHYLRAFVDPDREVRRAAIEAAARTRQPWLLERLRETAAAPSARAIDEHLALAVLGGPVDLPQLLTASRSKDVGWYRFAILGLCGRAAAVDELVRLMGEPSAVVAALAGAAFFRVTGLDVQRSERVPLVPDGAEPDELGDEIRACDAGEAEKKWRQVKSSMANARWSHGIDVESLPAAQLPLNLDLETRWGLQLRAAFAGADPPTVFDAETFPFG